VPVDQAKPDAPGQGLRLTLKNARLTQVASAEVAVRGYPSAIRVAPTVLRNPDPDEIVRFFPVSGAIAPGESTSFEFSLKDLGTVTRIDVESLTYADGTVWRPANFMDRLSCRVSRAPMEVTGIGGRR
jgi:hypothetical protein